jgi:D-arabinose 1-dehydrogenase-like Zn-dependent alcohol dehydrogenase
VRRVAGGLEDHLYEATHGGCFGAGDVPHPAEGLLALAQGHEGAGEVIEVRHGVELVGVGEYLSGLTLDGSGEDAVAHGGAPHHLP